METSNGNFALNAPHFYSFSNIHNILRGVCDDDVALLQAMEVRNLI